MELSDKKPASDKSKRNASYEAVPNESKKDVSNKAVLNKVQARFKLLIDDIEDGLFERQEIVSVTLLAAIAGQSVFLYGPPGTAKSLIARRVKCAFRDSSYFEYLMQRFSTPEDVFGPVSIAELKQDIYTRKTENYLPSADIAFLDEIWKSSPAILNTLLTIINERTFKNGNRLVKVPLRSIISASNEIPEANKGLDALYDRFIIRMKVKPLADISNFNRMISTSGLESEIESQHALTKNEWDSIRSDAEKVSVPEPVLDIINRIRIKMEVHNREHPDKMIYVSDRRWQKAVYILKVAAYLNGHSTVTAVDTLLLRHILWSSDNNMDDIQKIVKESVGTTDSTKNDGLADLVQKFDDLVEEVKDESFYREDILDLKEYYGREYFGLDLTTTNNYGNDNTRRIYIPLMPIPGFLVDATRYREKYLLSYFDEGIVSDGRNNNYDRDQDLSIRVSNSGDISIEITGYNRERVSKVTKVIKYRVGTPIQLSKRSVESFLKDAKSQLDEADRQTKRMKDFLNEQRSKIYSLFVPEDVGSVVLTNIQSSIESLSSHRLDVENLINALEQDNPHKSQFFKSITPKPVKTTPKGSGEPNVLKNLYSANGVAEYAKLISESD